MPDETLLAHPPEGKTPRHVRSRRQPPDSPFGIPGKVFALAFRGSPAPLAITRFEDGRILEVNDALLEMLGLEREAILGRTTVELGLWGDSRQAVMDQLEKWEAVRDLTLHWTAPGRTVVTRTSMVLVEYGGEKCLFSLFVDETDKERARAALEASEERYRAIIDRATDAITILGPDGVYADVNQAACTLFGYTRDELLEMRPSDLAAPEERGRQEREIDSLTPESGPLRTERRMLTGDGRQIWVEIMASKLPDGAGQAIIRDVTARKAAELRADRLLRLYAATADIDRALGRIAEADMLAREACRIAVEVAGFGLVWIGLLRTDQDGRFVEVVASAGSAVLQLKSARVSLDDEAERTRPGRIAIEEDRPVLTRYDNPETPEPVRNGLIERGLKSSLLIPLHVGGKPVGLLGIYDGSADAFDAAEVALLERIAEDVSFRLEAIERDKEYLRTRSELDRLAQAVDQASDGIMVLGPMGRILYANARFAQMVGRPREAIVGSHAGDILQFGVRRPDLAADVRAASMAQRPFSGEFEVIGPDGSPGWISLATTPVRDAAERVVNNVAVLRDVTREHQLEQQLRQAQKMEAVGQLAGGIAHDFNNLLTVIRGYADLARSQLGNSPAGQDVEAIEQAALRATELTRQLLQFARQTPVGRVAVDVNAVVESLCPMLGRLIGEDVELKVATESVRPTVLASPGQLEQVIVNLVVNAKDAMPGGGKLSIRTSDAVVDEAFATEHPNVGMGPHVVVTVSDSGCGIPPNILERIFDPFFTTKEPGKGTGLGLSMVFGAIRSVDGGVLVESVVGRGTTFRLYMPCAGETPQRLDLPGEAGGRMSERVGRGTTVLLVEDEDDLRSFAVRILERAGCSVLAAAEGRMAIAMAREYPARIDVMVTDVVMPGMSGLEAVAAVREIRPGLPAVFMSGYAEPEVGDLSTPDSTYVEKPFEPESLLAVIRNAVAVRR